MLRLLYRKVCSSIGIERAGILTGMAEPISEAFRCPKCGLIVDQSFSGISHGRLLLRVYG